MDAIFEIVSGKSLHSFRMSKMLAGCEGEVWALASSHAASDEDGFGRKIMVATSLVYSRNGSASAEALALCQRLLRHVEIPTAALPLSAKASRRLPLGAMPPKVRFGRQKRTIPAAN